MAAVTSSSMGVPYQGYRTLGSTIDLIDSYIDMVLEVEWEYLRMDPSGDALVVRRPVGVVGGVVHGTCPLAVKSRS